MAKDSWLTVVPVSGVGNATLRNSGTYHSGRLQRTTVVTAVVQGIDEGKSYQVSQKPTPEYITLDTTEFDVVKGASSVTITGSSNSPKITFSLGKGNAIPISLPTIYTANGVQATNGEAIAGDPGAEAEFDFSVTIPIPANTVGERVGIIVVTGSTSTVTASATITQATSTYTVTYQKGNYINTISKTSEEVDYGSTATATATILGNTVQYTYGFDGWYEGSVKVGSSLTLAVDNITENKTYVARGTRTLNRYTISFTYTPDGGGTASNGGTYDYGTDIQSTATPATGYEFVKWVKSDGTEYTQNPLAITVDGNKTFDVQFRLKSYTIGLSAQYRVEESGNYTSGTTGGTVSGGGTVTHGTSVRAVATPATGYSFVGWYEGSEQVSTSVTYTFTATGNRTLVARFQRKWFTIQFKAGSGGSVNPTSARVQYGGSASSTATPNTGHSFTSWSNGVQTAKLNVTNVTADATYTASFDVITYSISYIAGTGIASVSSEGEAVEHGSDAVGSTATLATGYDFDGWYNAGGTRVSTSLTYAPTNVTSSQTYTAKGTLKTFSVTGTSQYRDTDSTGNFTTGMTGGSVTGSGTYDYGEEATLKATAETGYTFLGWYNSGGSQISTSTSYTIDSVTASVQVYARFQKKWFTVTYSKGTGIASTSKASERVAYNGSTSNVTATLATGYTSGSWAKTSGTATVNASGLTVSLSGVQSDVVMTCSATLQQFTITYTKNGNIASISKTTEKVNYGGTATCVATLPANTAQYTYTFGGWYEGSSQISTSLSLGVPNIIANRTFEARGTATINRYTLTVNNGSGSGTYNYGTEVTITANAIAGKTFKQWSDGNTNATRQVTVTGNATYTAQYDDNYYTVTYNKGTGVTSVSRASESVIYGGDAQGSTATVTTGYTFNGWYSGGSRVSTSLTYAPTNVTSNITLEARATINTYTITVSTYYRTTDGTGSYTSGSTGGTASGGGTVNYGGSKTVTASAATGYKFDGWYSAGASGGSLLSSNASYTITNVTSSRTVYARFTRRYFTITYSEGDYVGSLSRASERVAYGANAAGSTITPLSSTTQYTYAVDGWYRGSSKVTSAATYAPTNVTADATYTAKCTRTLRSYTVTYTAGSYISSVSRASETVSYGSNASGSTATVNANTAQYSYSFDGWYNGSNRVSTSLTYAPTNITGNMTLQARATRTLRSYSIGVSLHSTSTGHGSVSGGGTYDYGESVTVHCTVNSGDAFDGWYEGGTRVSTDKDYTFTCTGARTLVAKILYLNVSPTSLDFTADGGTKSITVDTNIDGWTVS